MTDRLDPDPIVPCEGCGGPPHGPVGEERRCLLLALRAARAEAKASKQMLGAFTSRHSHQATVRT